jgi:hypothetical protein
VENAGNLLIMVILFFNLGLHLVLELPVNCRF